MLRHATILALTFCTALFSPAARATVLWSDAGPVLVHENGAGTDLLHGAAKHDDSSDGALYFKFHLNPLSDVSSEAYSAAFQLFEGDTERLAVGNSLKAWAYSAFNTSDTGENNKVAGDVDLRSSHPESYGAGDVLRYELPRRGIQCTIIFKVQFVPDGDDLVTVWMNPDLSKGATEESQPENLTTHFKARASFDQIRLRHSGLGGGWTFSELAVATAFNDFIMPRFWQQLWFIALMAVILLAGVAGSVRVMEKKKFQFKLQQAEQERALERERARIAQDLHDDLGSLLTRISLLGGLLRADKDNPEQVETHAGKISQSADQTVRALEEIVWAVRPGSDTLQSLVDYIAHFANELFEDNPARCRLDLPAEVPALPLPPDVRHNIFLIVKEALTNVLKHAAAHEVQVSARVTGKKLALVITDDGRGFDFNAATTNGERNGLVNMRRRAEAVGGRLTITSAAGQGTRVEFNVDFPG